MLLTRLDIKNFRGIEDLCLPLDDLCVFIGENNTGKSSVLDALRICLTRPLGRRSAVFEEYDYHLEDAAADPSRTNPIEITLTFGETEKGEWPEELSQFLIEAQRVDDEGLTSVALRVTGRFDATLGDYATNYGFVGLSGEPLPRTNDSRALTSLREFVPTFYLASLRDAAREFRAGSPFWGPFVRSLRLDDDARTELEAALSELNKSVLEKHTAFGSVKEPLEKTAELMPLGDADPVSIDAVPSKAFDILSRTQVYLTSRTGASIPVARHGSGTQSLAVICLFDAFLQSRLKKDYGPHAKPVLAMEEPEAHLHPSAAKAVGKMLEELSGQKLVSTHSGELLAGVPLRSIRRFRRRDGKITVHSIRDGALTQDEIDKLDYHVRATRGGLLFSRCWLLVEGETEATLLSECARAMGYDFRAESVSCIEFSQVGVEKFIKLADQLGIEWFMLADGDAEGLKYKKTAVEHLNGRQEADHIRVLEHGDMEVFLCMEGFGSVYEESVSGQKKDDVTAEQGTPEYWEQVVESQQKGSKTKNSLLVAEQMFAAGNAGVPELLRGVVEQARKLARDAG